VREVRRDIARVKTVQRRTVDAASR
jgi:ribosomal protein L29